MNVGILIEKLEAMDPETEVLLAIQSAYPFQLELANVSELKVNGTKFAYITEGTGQGHVPEDVIKAIGW